MLTSIQRTVLAIGLLLVGLGTASAQTSVPHSFDAGEVISATEMNENFDAVTGAIDALVDDTESPAEGYEVVTVRSDFDSTSNKSVGASCPDGAVATGGGGSIFPTLADGDRDTAPIAITSSVPSGSVDGPNRWFVRAIEMAPYAENWHLTAYVICRSR